MQALTASARGCLPRVSSDGYDAYTQALSEQVKAVTLYPLQWALTYAFAKKVESMDDQCAGDKTCSNFCRKHRGLKGETLAMRQGITDHIWRIDEVSHYRSAVP